MTVTAPDAPTRSGIDLPALELCPTQSARMPRSTLDLRQVLAIGLLALLDENGEGCQAGPRRVHVP